MNKRYMLLAVVALLLSGISIYPATAAESSPQRVEVTAKRFNFEPAEITLKKGQPVVLELKSEDVSHGLRIRELNVDFKVNKGKTGEVEFTPEQTGDFVAHCSVFCGMGHGKMQLTLHVVQ